MTDKRGTVYLVGAGCGDADLITLRGMNLLKQCDTVIYDSLIDSRLLEFVPMSAEKICVGKRCGLHSETQENINVMLVAKAEEGKNVVRLKGGDPFVFGRGGEEIAELQKNHVPYDIVPGISSAIAVPELAGIPVTHRKISRSVHIITGHTADDFSESKMKSYAQLDGTLVFLMGLQNLEKITESLTAYGKDKNTPSAVISDGAGTCQRIVTAKLCHIAAEVRKEKLSAPAVIVVGETAAFDFLPTTDRPLAGKKVTVTGTIKFVNRMSVALERKGAMVERLAHLNVVEYKENSLLDNALKNITDYNIIVLTSINGAEIFFRRMAELKMDIRKLSGVRFAAIGTGTAGVLKKRGIFPEIMPDIYTSEALGNLLCRYVTEKDKLLILRAEQGSAKLTDILKKNGICYNEIKVYHVMPVRKNEINYHIKSDYITFGSSSGVRAFFENGFILPENIKIICIGSVTADTLRQFGINHFVIAKTSCADGIIEAIIMEEKNHETIQKIKSK